LTAVKAEGFEFHDNLSGCLRFVNGDVAKSFRGDKPAMSTGWDEGCD
jgi:hypothetical protein